MMTKRRAVGRKRQGREGPKASFMFTMPPLPFQVVKESTDFHTFGFSHPARLERCKRKRNVLD